MIKKILSVLALSSVAVMGLSSVSASAMVANSPLVQSDLKVVNSKNGLAFRGANCKKTGSVKNKATLILADKFSVSGDYADQTPLFAKGTPLTKTCKINGKNVKMVLAQVPTTAGEVGYVSSKFLTPTYTVKMTDFRQNDKLKLMSKTSLNVRDANCKVVTTVKANVDIAKALFGNQNFGYDGFSTACKFGNKYYDMIQIGDKYVSPTGVYVK